MRIFLLVVLSFALWGCKERTDVFSFDCIIYDQKINSPVANASVKMSVQSADGSFNPTFILAGSTTTDNNGSFYLEIDKEVFYSYRLEVSHPQHFDGVFAINPDDVPINTPYSNTFNLEPTAWVSTRLFNIDSSQSITVGIEAETNICSTCCSSSGTIISGFTIDTTLVCQVFGAQNIKVVGTFTSLNGGFHGFSETHEVAPFDTLQLLIEY